MTITSLRLALWSFFTQYRKQNKYIILRLRTTHIVQDIMVTRVVDIVRLKKDLQEVIYMAAKRANAQFRDCKPNSMEQRCYLRLMEVILHEQDVIENQL